MVAIDPVTFLASSEPLVEAFLDTWCPATPRGYQNRHHGFSGGDCGVLTGLPLLDSGDCEPESS
jgi:hypothetical protein